MKQRFDTHAGKAMTFAPWAGALLFAALVMFTACHRQSAPKANDPLLNAYATEADWNNPDHMIPLNYQQAQGQRIFYDKCVWCHADTTPAGPSNRSLITPAPPLMNDGATLNSLSDEFLQNYITLGGAAMGKSAMEPAWGKTLNRRQVREVIAFMRAIAQPAYQPPPRPGPQYSKR
jgi:mono/diheme cytochrome c family protein